MMLIEVPSRSVGSPSGTTIVEPGSTSCARATCSRADKTDSDEGSTQTQGGGPLEDLASIDLTSQTLCQKSCDGENHWSHA